MALLYPKYEAIKSLTVPPTQGELAMIEFLLENLDDEYEIYFQPFLNGDCPDIILMRKGGGVLIIEVKDWQLSNYYIDEEDNWYVRINDAPIKSPISQVLKYKENMYNLHIPHLLELRLKNPKYYAIINTAVFFYKESQQEIMNFLLAPFERTEECTEELTEQKSKKIKSLSSRIVIIGNDNLNVDYLNGLLDKKWISRKSNFFTEELYKSFKRYLKPSFHSLENGLIYKYTNKQIELSTSNPREQKIRGLVGSGKTLVLAKRAVDAHKRTKDTVLILTYNISLKNYIHDRISNVREDFYWHNFHIMNYHDFITSTMNNLGMMYDIPKAFKNWSNLEKEKFYAKFFDNINLFANYTTEIRKYKTILIDEVQDYETTWLKIIKKYFLEVDGEFVVLGDGKQDIYNRVSFVNNKKSLQIPDIIGRWAELNRSFRLTPTLTAFAAAFQNHFLLERHDIDTFEGNDSQKSFFDKVQFKYFETIDYEKIADFISTYSKENKTHPNDVCVLSLKIETIREIDYYFRKLTKEKSYIMAETKEYYELLRKEHEENYIFNNELKKIRKNKKLNFWMNSGVTKFSTVHSFKGWEIKTLILIVEKDSKEENYRELIYTGFTRCMNNLVIINVGDKELYNFMNELDYVERI